MQSDVVKIQKALRDVVDFEIGLDVMALGFIRDIDVSDDSVKITMILTSPMCPMASFMLQQVHDRAVEVCDKPIEVVLGKERWTAEMMEPEARDALGI